MKNLWDKFTDYFGRTIIHPQFIMHRFTYQAVKEAKKRAQGKLVDIGCGRMPYRNELEPLVNSYTGVDHPKISRLYYWTRKPEVLADATNLPFSDNTFDIALMLQVIEYLKDPLKAIQEAERILKPKGIFILSSPFLYPLHDIPYDRVRYSDTALKDLLRQAGFKIIKLKKQGNFLDFWVQSLNVFLARTVKDVITSKKGLYYIFLFPLLLIIFPIIVAGNLIAYLNSLFLQPHLNYFPLNYLIVAKKR